MEFYLHTKNICADGTTDCDITQKVEHKESPIPRVGPWGLIKGAPLSGYGARILTDYMVRVNGKWRRVYCRIYSSSRTLFIGKKYDGSAIVRDYA